MTVSPEWRGDLQTALAAYKLRPTQASNRMTDIQAVVIAELARRFAPLAALAEVKAERPVRGKHRLKNWDVRFTYANRPQLAISTKSIISNVSGTVPNRIDDAMGECVNVHAHDPGMVLGYLFVMDKTGGAQLSPSRRQTWADYFADSLVSFSGRRSEHDAPELFEAAALFLVEFEASPPTFTVHPALLDWDAFFDILIGHVRARNPVIDLALNRGTPTGEPG